MHMAFDITFTVLTFGCLAGCAYALVQLCRGRL